VCLVATTLTHSRMATLALLVAPILYPHFKGKLMWKMAAVGVFVVLGLVIFQTQTFQERFFQSGQGTLSDVFAGDFKDQGRFEAWAAMWDEAWNRPVLGAGVGASFEYVPTIWPEMNHIHNDYLRIFFEFGLIGFALFVSVCAWQLSVIRRQIDARSGGAVRTAFSAAWLGFCVMLITCTTDNTIIYNVLFTNPLFAVLGAAFGVAWAEEHGLIESDAPLVARPPTRVAPRRPARSSGPAVEAR
jgi:O-antigen ligase